MDVLEINTAQRYRMVKFEMVKSFLVINIIYIKRNTYPGRPPDSIWLAKVTSSLHTSNCHFLRPRTPHRTFPVWIPIRMSTSNPVASRTNLRRTRRSKITTTIVLTPWHSPMVKYLHGSEVYKLLKVGSISWIWLNY